MTSYSRHKYLTAEGYQSGTWYSWKNMVSRCNKPENPAYPNYGGRGITVCPRWNYYENFLEDMGVRPPDLTLDRIENNGNYEPDNCRWANRSHQNQNRRDTVMVWHEGQQKPLASLAGLSAVPYKTLRSRISRGWEIDRALKTPSNAEIWFVKGYRFPSAQSAANKFGVSSTTIRHWCLGYKTPRRGVLYIYPSLPECWVEGING